MSARTATRVVLDGEITVHGAADLKSTLLTAVSSADGAGIELDLSGVSELDTAGLQLLLMVKLQAEELGGTLLLVEPSAAVTEVLALARLDPRLEHIVDPAVPRQQAPDQNGGI